MGYLSTLSTPENNVVPHIHSHIASLTGMQKQTQSHRITHNHNSTHACNDFSGHSVTTSAEVGPSPCSGGIQWSTSPVF